MRLHLKRLIWRTVGVILVLGGLAYWVKTQHFDNNSSHVRKSDQNQYPGQSHTRMHGIIGRKPDGSPGYAPSPCPQPPINMAKELSGNGFFKRLSDCLPLDRNITDGRHEMCKRVQYDLDSLPTTSVIFVFHNEAFSTLLRSIHSVLNRTPPQLLHEIILVDDGSTHEWLGQQLEDYIALLPKTRLVRLGVRSGLVKARLKGIEEATADTFTILDSHIEVEEGWCEPIMARIKGDRRRVIMPQIDGIDQETLAPRVGGIGCSLGFLWNLIEHSIPIQKKDQALRTSPIDAVRSPTMAGGLFTAHREFFWELGGYDTEFGFWGTENLEFSFRIWQCGGFLECMPCSRIHHIFRKGGHAYSLPPGHVSKNKLRTAAIWMDEYAFIVNEVIGATSGVPKDIGPLDEMKKLRDKLQCHGFDWFLKNVYPEGIITDRSDIRSLGEIRNEASGKCIDTLMHRNADAEIGSYNCHGKGSQSFLALSKTNEIRPIVNLELCITAKLTITWCDYHHDTHWIYGDDETLKNTQTNQCLAIDSSSSKLIVKQCDSSDEFQKWVFSDRSPAVP